MKKSSFIAIIAALVTIVLSQSCLPDTYYGEDPMRGSIVRFYFSNADGEVSLGDSLIYVTLPRGTNLKTLVPHIIISKDAQLVDFVPDQPTDFSSPVNIIVKGTDNHPRTYTVIAELAVPRPGFVSVEELFEIRHESLTGEVANSLQSIAVSGDKLVLLTKKNLFYFDALTGRQLGTWGSAKSINRLTSDSKGRLICTNAANNGGNMLLLAYDDVNASLVTLFNAPNPTEGMYGNGAQLSAYGDTKADAVVFTPIWRNAKTSQVFRWGFEGNGTLSSESPKLIEYQYDKSLDKPYGNIGFGIPLGPKVTDGYILGDRTEAGYHKNGVKYIFDKADFGQYTYGGPIGGKVFVMSDATYFAIGRAKLGLGGAFNILDISNPEAIAMSKIERETARIKFVAYESGLFRINSDYRENVGMVAQIDVKPLPDGNMILYFMYCNSGIKAYKLIKDPDYQTK